MHSLKKVALALVTALGLVCFSLTATAVPVGALQAAAGAPGGASKGLTAAAVVATLIVDVTGINSVDGPGSPLNTVITSLLPASAHITGIGWDTEQFAIDPSWLSEMVIAFGSSAGAFVNLTTGIGDNFPGGANYTSGGIVDLVGIGLDFFLAPDGQLIMEFFESFNDFPGATDGIWAGGNIAVRYEFTPVATPEPASLALVALALLGIARTSRLRRRS